MECHRLRRLVPWMTLVGILLATGCGSSPSASPNIPRYDSHKKHALVPGRGGHGHMAAEEARRQVPPSRPRPTPPNGQELFAAQCATCHGRHGEGGVGPPLNTRAAREHFGDSQARMADFIQENMPFNRPKTLSASQAKALAAYIWRLGQMKKGGHR